MKSEEKSDEIEFDYISRDGKLSDHDFEMIMGVFQKEHLEKLNSSKIETDEDYQKLGEQFPEDE